MRVTCLICCFLCLLFSGCADKTTQGLPPAGSGAGAQDPTASSAAQPGEIVIERYKNKGILLVATPSKGDASYKQFLADAKDVNRLADEIELTVIEIVGGQSGTVRGGPALDAQSITQLVEQYVPDTKVMTAVVIGGSGKEILKQTGEVNVKSMLQTL